jgi:hypothetical protein
VLWKLLIAFALMATCVVVHATGVTAVLRSPRLQPDTQRRFWQWSWLFIRLATWIIFCHLVEITVWAMVYWWTQSMPSMQAALYFSAVTYTTTGYGDLVLPVEWRLVGGVEALTGILMCGWSTGFFFSVVSRMPVEVPAHPSR